MGVASFVGAMVGFGTSAAVSSFIPALGVVGASVIGGMAGGATTAAMNHGNILQGVVFGGLSSGLISWGFKNSINSFATAHSAFGLAPTAIASGIGGASGTTIGSTASDMLSARHSSYFDNNGRGFRDLEEARSRYRDEQEGMLRQYEERIREYEKSREDLKHVLTLEQENALKKEELERELKERNKRSMGIAAERREKERQIRLREQIGAEGLEVLA